MSKSETKAKTAQTQKAWKVTITGDYRKTREEYIDFKPIVGYLPYVEEDLMMQAVRKRYAQIWLMNSPQAPTSLYNMRRVDVDKFEVVEHEFSYIGKSIAEMDMLELQDLAVACDLRRVPIFKKVSLRVMQNIAYAEYAKQVLQWKPRSQRPEDLTAYKLLTDDRADGFNVARNKPIVVGAMQHRDTRKKLTNDEYLDAESRSTSLDNAPNEKETTLTIDELKQMADQQGIVYSHNIKFETLYNKIYGASAA